MKGSVLEDPLGHAEGRARGEEVRDHADGGDQRSLQGHQQEQEAKTEDHADHERRPRRERTLQVVVLGYGAPDQRARWQRAAQALDRACHGWA